jgi:hypothetical protein
MLFATHAKNLKITVVSDTLVAYLVILFNASLVNATVQCEFGRVWFCGLMRCWILTFGTPAERAAWNPGNTGLNLSGGVLRRINILHC